MIGYKLVQKDGFSLNGKFKYILDQPDLVQEIPGNGAYVAHFGNLFSGKRFLPEELVLIEIEGIEGEELVGFGPPFGVKTWKKIKILRINEKAVTQADYDDKMVPLRNEYEAKLDPIDDEFDGKISLVDVGVGALQDVASTAAARRRTTRIEETLDFIWHLPYILQRSALQKPIGWGRSVRFGSHPFTAPRVIPLMK